MQLSLFKTKPADLPFRQTEKGIELWLKVTPKASKNRIGDIGIGPRSQLFLKVYVTAAPENNQANKAVIDLISEKLGIAKSQLTLISGLTSREKTILITGIDEKNLNIFEK